MQQDLKGTGNTAAVTPVTAAANTAAAAATKPM